MRFKRSQLLKNVSQKQLIAYQEEQGFTLMDLSHEEISLSEMAAKLYGFLRYSGNMMLLKHYEPTAYLNTVDLRKRIMLDLSRCLVTAKKLGEDMDNCPPAEDLFNYMIKDLSLHARCLSDRAMTASFGYAYHEAAFTLYSEVCALIRRLKVTRRGYAAIKTLPGAVLCDAPKPAPRSENISVKNESENEHRVLPEHAISPIPTVIVPETKARNAEAENPEAQTNTEEIRPSEETEARVMSDTEEPNKTSGIRKAAEKETSVPEKRRSGSPEVKERFRDAERMKPSMEADPDDDWLNDDFFERVPTDPREQIKWVAEANQAVEDLLAEMKEYLKVKT